MRRANRKESNSIKEPAKHYRRFFVTEKKILKKVLTYVGEGDNIVFVAARERQT